MYVSVGHCATQGACMYYGYAGLLSGDVRKAFAFDALFLAYR